MSKNQRYLTIYKFNAKFIATVLFQKHNFYFYKYIPLPKIQQLNKHYFYLCNLLEHPRRVAALQGLVWAMLIIKLYPIPYPSPQSRHIVRGIANEYTPA